MNHDAITTHFFLSSLTGLQSFFFLSQVARQFLQPYLPGTSHSFGLSSRHATAQVRSGEGSDFAPIESTGKAGGLHSNKDSRDRLLHQDRTFAHRASIGGLFRRTEGRWRNG
jgi:hypothetical protein